eukprot:6344315-Prymnesium_polylepis.1
MAAADGASETSGDAGTRARSVASGRVVPGTQRAIHGGKPRMTGLPSEGDASENESDGGSDDDEDAPAERPRMRCSASITSASVMAPAVDMASPDI